MKVDAKLVRAVQRKLKPCLWKTLGLATSEGPEKCASYLAEDPETADRRASLLVRHDMFVSCQKVLHRLSSVGPPSSSAGA